MNQSVIDSEALNDIRDYLMEHEYEIFLGENDFWKLKGAFTSIIGREPERSFSK